MPLYEYECRCGKTEDAYRSIDERHNAPKCHGPMKLVIGRRIGFVQGTFDPYVSPATGEVITSHAKRRDDFKKSDTRPWEGLASERKEASRRVAYADQARERRMDEAVHRIYHQMPARHRRAVEGR